MFFIVRSHILDMKFAVLFCAVSKLLLELDDVFCFLLITSRLLTVSIRSENVHCHLIITISPWGWFSLDAHDSDIFSFFLQVSLMSTAFAAAVKRDTQSQVEENLNEQDQPASHPVYSHRHHEEQHHIEEQDLLHKEMQTTKEEVETLEVVEQAEEGDVGPESEEDAGLRGLPYGVRPARPAQPTFQNIPLPAGVASILKIHLSRVSNEWGSTVLYHLHNPVDPVIRFWRVTLVYLVCHSVMKSLLRRDTTTVTAGAVPSVLAVRRSTVPVRPFRTQAFRKNWSPRSATLTSTARRITWSSTSSTCLLLFWMHAH